MSVSGELLCSFELLKPLDSTALKNHIKKGRNKRNSMLSSPVSSSCSSGCSYSPCNDAGLVESPLTTSSPQRSPHKAINAILCGMVYCHPNDATGPSTDHGLIFISLPKQPYNIWKRIEPASVPDFWGIRSSDAGTWFGIIAAVGRSQSQLK